MHSYFPHLRPHGLAVHQEEVLDPSLSIIDAHHHLWQHEAPRPVDSAMLAQAWAPYIKHCIAAFGVERYMFESNFPMDKTGCSYRTLWNAFKRLAQGASASEKAALLEGTAARVYRL